MGNVLILHTSESDAGSARAVADYLRQKNVASNEVFDPSCNERIQLIPWSQPSRALRNLSGGVETNNRGGVRQVEIIGRAADVLSYSNQWYQNLAAYVRTAAAESDVPLMFPCPFVAYPQSYGFGVAQRLDPSEWLTIEGVIGHQHVPENDHGDPGDLSRLVALLTEEDMTVDEFVHALGGEAAGVVKGLDGIVRIKLSDGNDYPLGAYFQYVHTEAQKAATRPLGGSATVDVDAIASAVIAQLKEKL